MLSLVLMVMIDQLGVKQLLKHADLAQHVSVDIRLFGNDLLDQQDAVSIYNTRRNVAIRAAQPQWQSSRPQCGCLVNHFEHTPWATAFASPMPGRCVKT